MPFSDESHSLPVFEQVKLASYSFPEEYWGEVSEGGGFPASHRSVAKARGRPD